MVRLDRGAVILDSCGRAMIELREDAAAALDTLFDVEPETVDDNDGGRARHRYLSTLGRELLNDLLLHPEKAIRTEFRLGTSEMLFRRHAEPASWRSATPGAGAVVAPTTLTLGLARTGSGVLALSGTDTVVSSVVRAFRATGADEIAADDVAVCYRGAVSMRGRAWSDEMHPTEIWWVEFGVRPGLTLVRLAPERALLNLLAITSGRPAEGELEPLALCAERVRHFAALVPREPTDLARAVADYATSLR